MPNNDYILRSDAVKAILGVSIYDTIEELEGARTIAENTWADGLWDAYKIIEEEVDAADVEPKQRWIPVTERLPDAEDHYLAAYKLANGEAFCDILYYGFMDFKADEGMCFYKYDSEWGDVKYDGVTHWMRMPEIPKEEDDE